MKEIYSRPFSQQTPAPKNYSGTLYNRGEITEQAQEHTPPKNDNTPEDSAVCKNTEKPPLFGKSSASQFDTEDLLLLGLVILLMANKEQTDIITIIALLFAVGIF